MAGLGEYLLQRVRILGSRFFYHFGLHCATHQIRVILISCVVITSLFYPALAIYSSQPQSLPDSTSRILDSFLAATPVSGLRAQRDLHNIWTGHKTLRVREDAFSRTSCGLYRTLRLERLLIQSSIIEDAGALNHQILQSTLHLESRISELLSSHKISCLVTADERCFVLTPLAFWNYDEDQVLADANVLDTLGLSKNVSISGVPVTPHMVLAGRAVETHGATNFDSAMYLALTYFFPEEDCLGNSDHDAWVQIIRRAANSGTEVIAEAQAPTLLALQYDTSSSRIGGFSAISTFQCLAYIAFFTYVSWSMRRMDAVHSRIGLTFTALVEIAVSTITSLSVCALVGFKVTMVPWELLPIVIVFVGAENMFSLVDAVVKTSVTLPVKRRIAEGLSRAGTSNTLKVVSYNAILGVIAVFAAGAIRQFCVFAIVVLVAHWFLGHTFFIAVLSIDIQRLELDELLRQNATLAPNIPNAPRETPPPPQSRSRWRKAIVAANHLLKGRATKNLSLVLLLAITATLYYTTYPASTHNKGDPVPASPRAALFRPNANVSDPIEQTPARHIWKLLNPEEDDLLHIRIEMPTVLVFGKEDFVPRQKNRKLPPPRFSTRTFKLTFRMLKIVVVPITATTTVLYGILLYLLKDAELLEAQRNRAEPDEPDTKDERPLEGRVSFMTLPRAFPNDVELIAASADGRIVAAVGLQNELSIWRTDSQSHTCIDTTDILLRAASTSSANSDITAVAVDPDGRFCAVGTGAGTIAVWSIDENCFPLSHLSLENSSSSAVELQFFKPRLSHSGLDPTFHASPMSLLAIYENGVVITWSVGNTTIATSVIPSSPNSVLRCMSFPIDSDERMFVAFIMDDGSAEIIEVSSPRASLPLPDCRIRAGNPRDRVSRVHGCCSDLGNDRRLLIGAVTEAGAVSLWDAGTGECISVFDDIYGEVSGLRISSAPSEPCHYCGELPSDKFSATISVGHVVLLYQVCLPAQTRRCSCAHNQPGRSTSREHVLGRHSRSNSLVPIAPSHFGRMSATFDTSTFPVSGHGIHSRRASEKDSRRSSDNLSVTLPTDERNSDHSVGPLDTNPVAPSSFWHEAIVTRVADAVCERGSWDVSGANIVGVRRKARSRVNRKNGSVTSAELSSSAGLTAAALDRWELWLFDPSTSRLQVSPLVALDGVRAPVHRSSNTERLSQQDLVPRLPFTRVSPFVGGGSFGFAGFGNTIGYFSFPCS